MSVVDPKIAGLVTIRQVIMSVLNRLSTYDLKSYKRLVQIAIEGYTELALWHINSLEVVYLHMSAAKTVNLPSDFISYTKIGIPINGKLKVLTNKEQILLPRLFDTGEAVGNTDGDDTEGISNAIFFSDHFRGGAFIGGLFGLPGSIDSAYYRVDYENRQIVFSGETPRSEIVLEYVSSGLRANGSSLIPRETVPALRNYVLWQMVENDFRIAYNEKERRKREYEESVEALRSFVNSFTADEYKRMVYSTARQTPKR
jgi:hypothetical protein